MGLVFFLALWCISVGSVQVLLNRKAVSSDGDPGLLRKPIIVADPLGAAPEAADLDLIKLTEPEAAREPGGFTGKDQSFGGVGVDYILDGENPQNEDAGGQEDDLGQEQSGDVSEIELLRETIARAEKLVKILPDKKRRLAELEQKTGLDARVAGEERAAIRLDKETKLLGELDSKMAVLMKQLEESRSTRKELVASIDNLKKEMEKSVSEEVNASESVEQGGEGTVDGEGDKVGAEGEGNGGASTEGEGKDGDLAAGDKQEDPVADEFGPADRKQNNAKEQFQEKRRRLKTRAALTSRQHKRFGRRDRSPL